MGNVRKYQFWLIFDDKFMIQMINLFKKCNNFELITSLLHGIETKKNIPWAR